MSYSSPLPIMLRVGIDNFFLYAVRYAVNIDIELFALYKEPTNKIESLLTKPDDGNTFTVL